MVGKNSSITALITQTIKLNFPVEDGKNLINFAKEKTQGRKGVKWFRIAADVEADKQGNGQDF
ncbi:MULTISPECIES: hypothetical protein [Microcystis]|uniref:hypothetical protein n=1 Tax=Microcystis TaxID=1125 RepID=UPI00030684B9|nr:MULTISPECIES: hypothetical protein [Microcystis]